MAEIPEYLQVDLELLEKAMEAHPEHAEGQQVTCRNLIRSQIRASSLPVRPHQSPPLSSLAYQP